jgi:uncharacterized membrane protein required for colicin V production
MNWVDAIIIVIALISAYIGYKQGLIRTVFSFIGLIVGVVLAGQWSDSLADLLSSDRAQWAYIVAFAIILIVVLVAANLAGAVLKGFIKFIMLGWLDSLGGIVLGLLVGAIAVAAILTSVGLWAHYVPGAVESTSAKAIGGSALANLLIDNFGLVLGLLPGEFDAVKEFFA